MDFSGADSQILLFGGYSGSVLADTWLWNGTAWVKSSDNTSNGRYAHGMAFDVAGASMIEFGGVDPNGSVSSLTCERLAASWSQAASGQPSARSNLVMAYDTRRSQVVCFGGATTGGARLADTWAWSVRPIITSQPVSGTACADRSQSFSVVAAGNGPFTYQWQRETSPGVFTNLADGVTAHGSLVTGAATATLSLSALTPADAGNYQCIVSNACGPVTSNSASLSISTLTGDLNCDCKVDLSDLSILLSNYGSQCQ